MSAEERKKNKTGKVQMICPGCLTVFIVVSRESEEKTKTPKYHYCDLQLEKMNLKEMSLKKQLSFLKSLLKSEGSTITGYLAVSAFKHYLISKEHPTTHLKPLLRWYNGQLAKEFIKKYYKGQLEGGNVLLFDFMVTFSYKIFKIFIQLSY